MPPCALIISSADPLEFGKIGRDAVLEHQAVVAAVVGLADRGVDADFGGDAADNELLDAATAQDGVEVGGVEGALAGLVDHRLAGRGLQLVDDVMTMFAAHEDAAHRTGIADAVRKPAARLLGGRKIGQIGAMALAGVDDSGCRPSRAASRTRGGRRDRLAQQRHVVAERFAEPAGIDEVALHVDDHERDCRRLENRIRTVQREHSDMVLLPGSAAFFALSGEIAFATCQDSVMSRAPLVACASHRKPLTRSPSSSSMVPMPSGAGIAATKLAELGQRHFPNLHLDCGADFGADETGAIAAGRRAARKGDSLKRCGKLAPSGRRVRSIPC